MGLITGIDPNGNAVNRYLTWPDPVFSLYGKPVPRRIVGIVADVDDENVVRESALTGYQPCGRWGSVAGCSFTLPVILRAGAGGHAGHRGFLRSSRSNARQRSRTYEPRCCLPSG